MKKLNFLLIIILILITACRNDELEHCTDNTALFTLADFPIGVAIGYNDLTFNAAYRNIVETQFNRITPGNAFKPDALQPIEGVFDFEIADEIVDFANTNEKRIHGHTLLWHNQLPNWMNNFSGDRNTWIEMMETHIKTIVEHFKGNVDGWDVVNEAFEDNGDFRENIWYQNIGEEYIRLAFEFAHEADSTAKLFYNDFNIAARNSKCEAILNHFKKLKSEGVPVHGIGLQLHIFTSTPSDNAIEKTTETIAKEGFLIHYSEIDISMNLTGGNMNLTDRKLRKQGEKMQAITETFRAIPTAQQYGMTVWGVSDLDSWIPSYFDREDYPLLYDEKYEPKPMYCGFVEGLL